LAGITTPITNRSALSSYWRVERGATKESDMLRVLKTCRAVAQAMGLDDVGRISWGEGSHTTTGNRNIVLDGNAISKGYNLPTDHEYDAIFGMLYHEIEHNLSNSTGASKQMEAALRLNNRPSDQGFFNLLEDWYVDRAANRRNPVAGEYIKLARAAYDEPDGAERVAELLTRGAFKDTAEVAYAVQQAILSTAVYGQAIPATMPDAVRRLIESIVELDLDDMASPYMRGDTFASIYSNYIELVDQEAEAQAQRRQDDTSNPDTDEEGAPDDQAADDQESDDSGAEGDEGEGDEGEGDEGEGDEGDAEGDDIGSGAETSKSKGTKDAKGASKTSKTSTSSKSPSKPSGTSGSSSSTSPDEAADDDFSEDDFSDTDGQPNDAAATRNDGDATPSATSPSAPPATPAKRPLPAMPELLPLEENKKVAPTKIAETVAALDRGDLEDITGEVQSILRSHGHSNVADATIVNTNISEEKNSTSGIRKLGETYRGQLARLFDTLRATNTRYYRGEESGKLSRSRLYRAPYSNTIFERKDVGLNTGVGIVLVLDNSSSIGHNWANVVAPIGIAFSGIGGKHETVVLAYTSGRDMGAAVDLLYKKGFEKARLGVTSPDSTPSGQGLLAGLTYAKRMKKKDRIIIHVTDGSPDSTVLSRLAQKEIEKHNIPHCTVIVSDGRHNVDMLKTIYPQHVVIQKMSELPEALEGLVRKTFTRK
jgi:hypothetical protein